MRAVPDPFALVRPLLHALDPEDAHALTLRALELGLVPGQRRVDDPALEVEFLGRRYPNPVGLAAGFDKNARVYDRMAAHGFGFVEIGGVTPRPQAGNPRPRVFRLPEDGAVINRMGFPGEGADAVEARLRARGRGDIPLWVNLASNAESADPLADFRELVQRFAPLADVLTLDVSCPNTANGQVFLEPAPLRDLVATAQAARGTHATGLIAKLGPDLEEPALDALVDVLAAARIDAIVVSNTTRARDGVRGRAAAEGGGLSGRPLFSRSTALLARIARQTGGRIPLVGVGGIASGADALAKLRAGATLVQLYTGLIYAGTRLVPQICDALAAVHRGSHEILVREPRDRSGQAENDGVDDHAPNDNASVRGVHPSAHEV